MRRTFLSCAGILLLGMVPIMAQRTAVPPPDLREITARAGTIFLGRVEAIAWKHAPGGGSADRVHITFRVLDGIRGAKTGEALTITEWSGLWAPGNERYRPGQTFFLFLYPTSRLGFTSPVAGEAGKLEMTPTQRVVLSPERATQLLPRSLRLQKARAAAAALREQQSAAYSEFAQIVRELAEARP